VTAPVRANDGRGLLLRLRDRAKEVIAGFSSGQKTVVVVAVLATVVGGYLFMSWAAKPTYVPLFSNLSSSDAAAITQKLATNKVPYELTEGGEQIMVPQGDVYQQRLDMAAAGLPASGDQGYSLLDSAGVTTSEFQQQVEYQQAVSDELEKTVESISGVSSSLVSVVIPQQSLFTDSSDQPSASVLVSLEPGASLSPEQVQAVVHLVASSIEGLSPDDVTVVDQNGDVLNAPGTDSGNVAAGTLEQQQTESYEQSLDNSLQDMLATVLGPGNAVVHTSAELDFDQTQISSQIYNPNNQGAIPVQEATSKEAYTGSGADAAAMGIMGATTVPASSGASAASANNPTPVTTTTTIAKWSSAPNSAGTPKAASAKAAAGKATNTSPGTTTTAGATTTTAGATTAAAAKTAASVATSTTAAAGTAAGATTTVPSSYTQEGSSQQNVVSEVTKSVNSAPGALERLSVAVVVNSSVKGVSSSEVSHLVSAAAGLQPSRGDTIQVAFVPFDQTAAKEAAAQLKAEAAAKAQATLMGEARDGAVVLFVLALLMFALRRITKTTRVPLALPAGYQQLELEPGESYEDEATMALPPAREPVPVIPPIPMQQEVAQLGQMIEREPERIAEMLRTWLETGPADR